MLSAPTLELETVGPILQTASLTAEGTTKYFPDTHGEHAAEPLEPLYVPAIQSLQGPPLAPVDPAAHKHWLLLLVPDGASD